MLISDIRFSLRMIFKNRAFAAVALISIALGIGANTAVFSVVNTVLLKSLPYSEVDRLVLVWGDSRAEDNLKERNQVSATDVADYRSQNSVFEEVTTFTGWMPVLSGGVEAERVPAIQVGDGFFRVMKGEPLLGRVFTPEEQTQGKDFVIVLSHGLWQRKFNSDPNIAGKTVTLNARPYTIVGVMGPDFQPLPESVVAPRGEFYRPVAEAYDESQRDARHLRSIARLKPDVSVEQAQTELSVIAGRLEEAHPESNKDYGVKVVSLTEDTIGGLRQTLLMVFGAVVFVLLVACANVGNLLLARSTARRKELSIRAALGASRGRIVRQLLTESLILSFAGGAFGLLFALWGTSIIEGAGAGVHPMLTQIDLDLRCLAFTFVISIASGLLFGLAPAMQVSKTGLTDSLNEGGRSGGSATSNRLRGALVVAEIALTLVLLVCAGLLIQTVVRLRDVDTGFNPEKIVTMQIGLPGRTYPTSADIVSFYRRALANIQTLPGVKAAGITSVLPLSKNFDGRGLVVEDRPKPPGEEINVDLYVATPGYLRALEIELLRGRGIEDQDGEASGKVALINRAMAEQLWAGEDPLGKRIRFSGDPLAAPTWRTVVGVVDDVSQYGLDKKPPMQIYVPHTQFATSFNNFVVKTDGEPAAMTAAVRGEILKLDPEQALYNVTTMQELMADAIALRRFLMLLLLCFAGLALLLAGVGIYGVMSYVVSQRTQEIGIRIALGAQRFQILKLVVGQGMRLAAAGVLLGIAAALSLTRLMTSLLFGISASDPVTFSLIALLLLLIATVACYVPARRAGM